MPKKTSQGRSKSTPKKAQTKKKKCTSTPPSEPVLVNENGSLNEEGIREFVSQCVMLHPLYKGSTSDEAMATEAPPSEPVLVNEDGTLTEEGQRSFVSGAGVPHAIPGKCTVPQCGIDIPHHLSHVAELLYELIDTLPSADHYKRFKRLPSTARQVMRMAAGALDRVYDSHENNMKEGDE